MHSRVAMTLTIAVALAIMIPLTARADLLWDANTGTGGVQEGAGTWINGGTNWWDAITSTNVPWNNASPTVAQFGNTTETTNYVVTVDGTVKATGVTCNQRYDFSFTNNGTIEINGTTFTLPVYSYSKFYAPFTTAAGVEKIVFRGNGSRTDEYVYLYNANDFDAPIEIGEAEPCAVFVQAGSPVATPVTLPGSSAGLGGDPTKSIAVFSGSTLGIRSYTLVEKNVILKGGTGYGSRGNLEFYADAFNADMIGGVTLHGDATIKTRATGKISGSLIGNYVLSVANAASNRPGAVTLTNSTNSSKGLVLSSGGGTDAVAHLILKGDYTVSELVTIGGVDGEATICSDATLTSPSVAVNDRGVLRGVGSVVGDVSVASGGTIEAGEDDIYNPADSVYYLDVASSIGTLDVTGNVTVGTGGTFDVEYDSTAKTIDELIVSGTLDLTGATLKLTDLGSSTLTGGPYVLATYGSLVGTPTVSGVVPAGYELVYNYGGNKIALVPEPSMLVLLAGLSFVLACTRIRC